MSNGTPTDRRLDRTNLRLLAISLRLAAIVLCAYWLVIFTLTHLPRIPQSLPRIDDKLAHFGAYFVLTILMCHTARSPRLVRRFSVIGIVAMTYGAIDELTQLFVPRRSCDVWDFACDVTGVWLAIAVYIGAKWAHQFLHQANRDATKQTA